MVLHPHRPNPMLSSTVTPDSSRDVVSMKPSAMYPKRKETGSAAPQCVKVMFVILSSVTNAKKKPE